MSGHEGLPEHLGHDAEHDELRPGRARSGRVYRRYLPVTHARQVVLGQASLCCSKLLEVLDGVWDPRCSVQFVCGVRAGAFHSGYVVSGMSLTGVKRLADTLAVALRSTLPWLGVGEVRAARPWPAPGRRLCTFACVDRPSRSISHAALPWATAAQTGGSWHFCVDIALPIVGVEPDEADDDETHSDKGDDVESMARIMTAAVRRGSGGEVAVMCSMSLFGSTHRGGDAVAALIAADTAGPRGLARIDAPGREAGLPAAMPIELVTHVLATPARVGELLPQRPVIAAGNLFERVEASPVPHILVTGATGQGKSTTLAHIADRTLRAGQPVVVFDIHTGEQTDRAADSAQRHGRPYLYARFGAPAFDADTQAGFRFQDPPDGVTAEAHIETLVSTLRDAAYEEKIPWEHMGTVGTKAARANWALCVYDPLRQYLPGDVSRLQDPRETSFRGEVLQRIGSTKLTRIVEREIMPMVSKTDADNAAVWLSSKFDAFDQPLFRTLASAQQDRLAVDEAIARGHSLLIHAPAAQLGEQGARLLISMIVQRVYDAIIRLRAGHRYTLFLDEWQKYCSSRIRIMLTEGRKHGMRVVAANQHLSQLDPETRDAILSNTGAILCYRIGPSDARLLDGVFPAITTHRMQTLPRHTMAVTTFDDDFICPAPAPLPAPTATPVSWPQQIAEFWNGHEPPIPPAPAVPETDRAPQFQITPAEPARGQDGSFLDDWLQKRRQDSTARPAEPPTRTK